MDLEKVRKYIVEQFVEDYEEIHKFMDNVNETLANIGIENKYTDYNKFCIDIEKNILDVINTMDQPEITTQMVVNALNNMVKYKVLEDENYEEKIKTYFNDYQSVIQDIHKLRNKNQD